MLDIKFDRIVTINGHTLIVSSLSAAEENELKRIFECDIPSVYRDAVEILENGIYFIEDGALIIFAVTALELASVSYDSLSVEDLGRSSSAITTLSIDNTDNVRVFIDPETSRLVYEFI